MGKSCWALVQGPGGVACKLFWLIDKGAIYLVQYTTNKKLPLGVIQISCQSFESAERLCLQPALKLQVCREISRGVTGDQGALPCLGSRGDCHTLTANWQVHQDFDNQRLWEYHTYIVWLWPGLPPTWYSEASGIREPLGIVDTLVPINILPQGGSLEGGGGKRVKN